MFAVPRVSLSWWKEPKLSGFGMFGVAGQSCKLQGPLLQTAASAAHRLRQRHTIYKNVMERVVGPGNDEDFHRELPRHESFRVLERDKLW